MFSAALLLGAQRQILTLARLVSLYDNDTLISWSLQRPDHWLNNPANAELQIRIAAGKLTPTEQQALFDQIVKRLAVNRGPAFEHARARLVDLNASRATIAELDARIDEYVLARWLNPDLVWLPEWRTAFRPMLAGGPYLPWTDEAATLFEQLCTPDLRVLPAGEVRPGELFIVTTAALRRQPSVEHRHLIQTFDLPQEIEIVMSGHVLTPGGLRHAASSSYQPLIVARAPKDDGAYEIHVTLGSYDSEDSGKRDSGTLIVSSDAPSASALPLDSWLTRRLAVVDVLPLGNFNPDRRTELLTVELLIAAEPGELSGNGRSLAIKSDGTRRELGTFAVLPRRTEEGIDQMPRFFVDVDSEYIESGSPWKIYLAFDHIVLPDGRSHDGPSPLMVELPADLIPSSSL